MDDMKPVTVHAGTFGEVTPLQKEGIDHVVEYLLKVFEPKSPLLPDTGRLVIEWGDEDGLAVLREDG